MTLLNKNKCLLYFFDIAKMKVCYLVNFFILKNDAIEGKVQRKKRKKTNVSLVRKVYAGNCEMLGFFSFFHNYFE